MPNIAELFVSLGIKGSEKTLNVLSNVKVGMGSIIDTSLAAKAAILAVVYALEQLTTGAAQDGAHLKNLSTYLNMSVESLQKWNYAAQQGNISNQEFEQSLGSIQQKIKDFQVKHTLPDGSYVIAQETGFNFQGKFGINEILPKLLEFSQNKKYSREKIEEILGGWGLTPNEIGAAINGIFSAANLKNAPILKTGEVDTLSRVNVEWKNLETKVKMFVAHLTAKDGEEAVKNLSKMADALFRIANDLERISTKLGLFKLIGTMFHGWDMILGVTADALEGKRDRTNDLENLILPSNEEAKKNINDLIMLNKAQKYLPTISDPLATGLYGLGDFLGSSGKNLYSGFKEAILDLDRFKLTGPGNSRFSLQEQPNNIHINQHLTFQNPGTDATKVMDIHSKSVGHAVAQATRNINQSRVT